MNKNILCWIGTLICLIITCIENACGWDWYFAGFCTIVCLVNQIYIELCKASDDND